MKHTDFYALHKKLDEQARNELVAAIKAHGGEYIFIHENEDGDYNNEEKNNAPIIAASTRYMDGYEDFYVVRVAIEDDWLQIYGFPQDGWYAEAELTSVAYGHLEYIIDMIPETENVQDVTIASKS